MIQAIRATYNRRKKKYDVEMFPGEALPILAHDNWLVFDNVERAIEAIKNGLLLSCSSEKYKAAMLSFLKSFFFDEKIKEANDPTSEFFGNYILDSLTEIC
jgi:hypothetical protein